MENEYNLISATFIFPDISHINFSWVVKVNFFYLLETLCNKVICTSQQLWCLLQCVMLKDEKQMNKFCCPELSCHSKFCVFLRLGPSLIVTCISTHMHLFTVVWTSLTIFWKLILTASITSGIPLDLALRITDFKKKKKKKIKNQSLQLIRFLYMTIDNLEWPCTVKLY